MTQAELYKLLDGLTKEWHRTGSRFICDPAPTHTDDDYIVMATPANLNSILTVLKRAGFEINTDAELYKDLPEFWALRKGIFNVVVTGEHVFYERFVAATLLAKERNLLLKDDRIALFRAILYAEVPA